MGVGSSRGPGTEFGTEISAKGQREPLDPEILSHQGESPWQSFMPWPGEGGPRLLVWMFTL